MSDAVLEFIRAQAVAVLGADPDTLDRATSLADEYDADSVDIVEIANAIERKFGVAIADHEIYDLKCVGDFVDLVDRKLAGA